MAIRVLICLGILAYASLLDWYYREIDDKSWISMVFLGTLFLIFDLFLTREAGFLLLFLTSVGTAVAIASILSYLNVMGGGDGKILIGIAAMVPSLTYPTLTVFPLFFFSVYFGNAVLLGSLFPIVFFIINLKHIKDVKSYGAFLALFLGYEKDVEDVGEFDAFLGRDGNFKLRPNKDTLGEKIDGKGKVWITPAIPFVILITVGFVISVIYGDILSFIILRYL